MILVTGATGTFGKSVFEILTEKHVEVKSGSRNSLTPLIWDKPETFKANLKGVKKVFLVSPPNYATFHQEVKAFLDVAKEEGVEFILLSTVFGINQAPESALAKTEEALKNCGIPFAIVRPNFIFQNFINFDSETIKAGKIYLPTGQGKTSYIDVRDVAQACVSILLEAEKHHGKIYTLTGNQSLSHAEIASVFSQVLAKKVENINPTPQEYAQTLTGFGLPEETVNFLGYLYSGIEAGYFETTTDDYQKITNTNPRSINTFIEEYKELFV